MHLPMTNEIYTSAVKNKLKGKLVMGYLWYDGYINTDNNRLFFSFFNLEYPSSCFEEKN